MEALYDGARTGGGTAAEAGAQATDAAEPAAGDAIAQARDDAEPRAVAAVDPHSVTKPCPDCGSTVPVDPLYVDWCAACGWNVDPADGQRDESAPGRIEALRRRLAHDYGEELFREPLPGDGSGARPGRGRDATLALLIASAVHALTLALAVGGLLLVVLGWSTVVQPVVGVVVLAVAYVLRPRVARLPKDVPLLHRADAPRLFGLIDEVAEVVGTRSVDVVVVEARANASVTTYGLKQRRMLTLGLALWESATPQQRIALLGHELGHYANGDTRSSIVFVNALRSLSTWLTMLDRTDEPDLFEMAANALTFLPRKAALGLLVVLDQLTLRSSQRAEYLADVFAARAGSGAAAAELMDLLLMAEVADGEVQRAAVRAQSAKLGGRRRERAVPDGDEDLWARVADRMLAVPDREYQRLRRLAELRGHSADSTHPPTHLRRRRLVEGEQFPARVVRDAAECAALAEELAPARAEWQRRVERGY
ncbi:M48 family metalloprotease [Streptomyces sp. NPDC048442]|uniref:M48 family metalloprotease n=1 Tax=Streptomyces sp. NPDC048442 TaxID=3154823 RepID=UPI00341DB0C9